MSLEDNIRALERTPVLAEIGRDALRLIAFSAETVSLRPGDRLFDKNAEANSAYTIISGRLKLDAGDGKPRIVGPGTLIGEIALVVPTLRPCEAVAEEPVRLLEIPRSLFRRMLDEFPQIAAVLKARLVEKMQAQADDLAAIQETLDRLTRG